MAAVAVDRDGDGGVAGLTLDVVEGGARRHEQTAVGVPETVGVNMGEMGGGKPAHPVGADRAASGTEHQPLDPGAVRSLTEAFTRCPSSWAQVYLPFRGFRRPYLAAIIDLTLDTEGVTVHIVGPQAAQFADPESAERQYLERSPHRILEFTQPEKQLVVIRCRECTRPAPRGVPADEG